ncbi:MAG: hypothetical protein WC879_13105 [Melioribacteraceae bacterium]
MKYYFLLLPAGRQGLISYFLLLISFSFLSCSSTETIIKDRKIELTIPAIKDTVKADYKDFPKPIHDKIEILFNQLSDSSSIQSEIVIPKSKIKGKIIFKPKTNDFILDIPLQKIDTTFSDTTKNIIKKEITFVEKIGYATIGIIIFIVLLIILFIRFKKKFY